MVPRKHKIVAEHCLPLFKRKLVRTGLSGSKEPEAAVEDAGPRKRHADRFVEKGQSLPGEAQGFDTAATRAGRELAP
jgi:hypothetical protein